MNVKRLLGTVPFFVAVVFVWPSLARSFEIPYIFSDPLRITPAVVEKGAILPGDTAPIPRSFQKKITQPLALVDAVDLALSNNPKLTESWADIKVQTGAVGQAYAAYLPVLNGSINWTADNVHYSDSQIPSTDINHYTSQASATWRIFDFGGRSANRHSAENLLAAALATYDVTLQEALAGVIQAYFDATTASASLNAKIKGEEISQSLLLSAQGREAEGATSQLDTLRAATALAKAALDKNRALGSFQKSLAVLRYYVGIPGSVELLVPSELDENQVGERQSKELSLWLDEAQKNHPSITAAKKQLEAAQEQMISTKSAGLPTIDLSGNYYQNTRPGASVSPGATETTLTVALSIPLFDGFASTYKFRGAQAQVEKQAAALSGVEQQVAMGIIKAHADTTSALRNLEASAKLLALAQSALATSQRRYENGAGDIAEVLSTQAALADAWNERVRALAEWHSARLLLLANAGKMGRFAVAGSAANVPVLPK